MAKLLMSESRVEKQINKIFEKQDGWTIGLLIGQKTDQKDFLLHIIETPYYSEIEEYEENKPSSLELLLSNNSVVFHAKQVMRMLIGGLYILGLFIHAPSDVMQEKQSKLKKILLTIHKMRCKILTQTCQTPLANESFYILQLCATNKKLSCVTFDTNDTISGLKPAEFRYQGLTSDEVVVNASISVNLQIPLIDYKQRDLSQQLQVALLPIYKRIMSALTTLNGYLIEDEETLIISMCGGTQQALNVLRKNARSKDEQEKMIQTKPFVITAKIYADMYTTDTMSVYVSECSTRLYIKGTVQGTALVHNRATVRESIQALKEDIVGTIRNRCEILFDELVQECDVETDIKHKVHITPKRVLASVSPYRYEVRFCDYLFTDEQDSDSVDRFKSLAGIKEITEADIQCIEHYPSEDDLIHPEELRKVKENAVKRQELSEKHSQIKFSLIYLGGSILAVVTAAVSFLYLGEN